MEKKNLKFGKEFDGSKGTTSVQLKAEYLIREVVNFIFGKNPFLQR